MERLRKKLSEQESLLLLMSPNMAFRVANRNGKVSPRLRCPLLCTAVTALSSVWPCRASPSSSHRTTSVPSGGRRSESSRRNVSPKQMNVPQHGDKSCDADLKDNNL